MGIHRKEEIEKENKNFSYKIRRKTFFTITAIIVLLFVFFQFMGNTAFFKYPDPTVTLEQGMYDTYLEQLSAQMEQAYRYETDDKPEVLVVSENFASDNMEISSVLETLEGMKILHQNISYEEAKAFEIEELQDNVKAVVVCGDVSGTALTRAQLDAFIDRGVAIIYTQMPEAEAIEEQNLTELFGIYQMKGLLEQKGIRFIDDVFFGKQLELYDLEYTLEEVKLEPTCKVYGYGLKGRNSEEIDRNEDFPPLLWRNTIDGTKVFVVNGKFFEENKGYGILTAIISDIYEDFLYPIVNASVMIYDSIPYDGEANEELMMELYSRNSLQFQTDILMPNIVNICKRLDVIPTFYTSAESKLPEMDYFERSVLDLGGELIYEESAQVKAIDITNPEGRIWDQCPNLPVIVTGFEKNDDDMVKLYSIGSTFGVVIHRVDISKIINADTADVDWVTVSKDYSEYIAFYQEDFAMLNSMTASDAAIRYMEYMIMQPKITYGENVIEVKIENMPEKACFVLRTEKEIKEVENGKFSEVRDGVYIIETSSDTIKILVEEKANMQYQGTF